jgi:hypothetical protein
MLKGQEEKRESTILLLVLSRSSFDRIISERSSLASSKPPSLQTRELKVDGGRTKG